MALQAMWHPWPPPIMLAAFPPLLLSLADKDPELTSPTQLVYRHNATAYNQTV